MSDSLLRPGQRASAGECALENVSFEQSTAFAANDRRTRLVSIAYAEVVCVKDSGLGQPLPSPVDRLARSRLWRHRDKPWCP